MPSPGKKAGSMDIINFLNSDMTPVLEYCEMDDCSNHSRLRCPACKLAMCLECHTIHIHSDVKGVEKKSKPSSARKEPSEHKKGKSSPTQPKQPHSVFEPYWDLARVEADLRAGRLKKGILEVPESKKEQATFRGEDGTAINIMGWEHRNRSLDGDTVAIQFHPNDGSKIIYNFTPIAGREFSGKLAMSVDLSSDMVAFSCVENKYPPFLTRLPASCVELLRTHMVRPTFKLTAMKWEANSKWPIGKPASDDELEKAIREKTKNDKNKLKPAVPMVAKKTFKPYVTEEELQAGLQSGELIQGILRIVSPKDAFVIARGMGVDVYLEGRKSRNRAFDGDTVVIRISPKNEWKIITEEKRQSRRGDFDENEGKFDFPEEFHPARALDSDGTPLPQPTGVVVHITHRPIEPVKVGSLEVSTNPDKLALFKPLDLKAPFAVLPKRDWPKEFQNAQNGGTKHFYVARFKEWKAEDAQPNCVLVGPAIGVPGTTEAETRVMLTECNVNYDQNGEFSPEILTQADNLLGAKLDFADRLDLRSQKMVTIDSSDANDVENGFTFENNSDGTINVGVHVTDVSWCIKSDSKIDQEARFRGCTVSLVHKTLPMLPRSISENLCSLIPGKDRLALSVIFRVTKDGKLVPDEKPQFRRSVVRSCCKLDYKAAQSIVAHGPLSGGNLPEELKEILLGPMQPVGAQPLDVINHVLLLHEVGAARRKTRFSTEGALSLQRVKLDFTLDVQQNPVGFAPLARTSIHFAVDELKLLANRFVAEELAEKAKDSALLIRQGPPDKARLDNVVHILQSMGIGLQTGSAAQLQSSLNHFQNKSYRGNIKAALEKLCLTPMQNASYFCPGQIAIAKASAERTASAFSKLSGAPVPELKEADEKTERHHFSKNLDAYTHFTSPLRRYADLEVQRWLTWSLDVKQPAPHELKEEIAIADHCNFRSEWAKKAQELSSRIFLSIYLYHHQPLGWEEGAVIVEVATHSFKVLVFRLGLEHRVNLSEVECLEAKITKDKILEIRHLDGTLEARQVFDEVQMLLYGSIEPPCQIRFSLKPRHPITALNPRGVPFSPRAVMGSPRGMINPFSPRANFVPHVQPSPTHANPSPRVGNRPRDLPGLTTENVGDSKGPKSQKNSDGQPKASNAKTPKGDSAGKPSAKAADATPKPRSSQSEAKTEPRPKPVSVKPEESVAKSASKPKPAKGRTSSGKLEPAPTTGTTQAEDKPRPRLSSTLSATSAVFTPASELASMQRALAPTPKVEKKQKAKRASSGPVADEQKTAKKERVRKQSRKSETQPVSPKEGQSAQNAETAVAREAVQAADNQAIENPPVEKPAVGHSDEKTTTETPSGKKGKKAAKAAAEKEASPIEKTSSTTPLENAKKEEGVKAAETANEGKSERVAEASEDAKQNPEKASKRKGRKASEKAQQAILQEAVGANEKEASPKAEESGKLTEEDTQKTAKPPKQATPRTEAVVEQKAVETSANPREVETAAKASESAKEVAVEKGDDKEQASTAVQDESSRVEPIKAQKKRKHRKKGQ